MLKLVVSNDIPVREYGPRVGLDQFHAGETLVHKTKGHQVLVMACGSDRKTAMLMPLPDGELYEARIEDMGGWETAYLSGPRMVEVRRKSSNKVEWCSYVADFDTALSLWRKLELCNPNDFAVEIFTQHPDELVELADLGYFDSNASVKPSA